MAAPRIAHTPGAEVPAPSGHAVVARVDFRSCLLLGDDGATREATVRGRLMGRGKALGNAAVVGDRVRFTSEHGRIAVVEVEPRRNAFSRRAAGGRPAEQVVAANLDQVVLVASVEAPTFKRGLADRVLGQAEHAGLPTRLVLNKLDLADPGEARTLLEDYGRAGAPGHLTSAKTGAGLDELRRALRGRRSLLIGHSGVGKSTLLNALVPGLDLLSRKVNPVTGKGRHTTTAAWLLRPERDLELIDTPGVRAFGLWGIGPRDLDQTYPEFRRFLGTCRFSDCRHATDPGCAVRAAVERGEIAPGRLASYLKLRQELESEERREGAR